MPTQPLCVQPNTALETGINARMKNAAFARNGIGILRTEPEEHATLNTDFNSVALGISPINWPPALWPIKWQPVSGNSVCRCASTAGISLRPQLTNEAAEALTRPCIEPPML